MDLMHGVLGLYLRLQGPQQIGHQALIESLVSMGLLYLQLPTRRVVNANIDSIYKRKNLTPERQQDGNMPEPNLFPPWLLFIGQDHTRTPGPLRPWLLCRSYEMEAIFHVCIECNQGISPALPYHYPASFLA
jgi:hypothetical protein